eukprot:1155968-Pelagomonas_calceolata.AAC.4
MLHGKGEPANKLHRANVLQAQGRSDAASASRSLGAVNKNLSAHHTEKEKRMINKRDYLLDCHHWNCIYTDEAILIGSSI